MSPVRLFPPTSAAAPTRRGRGFTLVEILTATAIMALMISLVMTILTQVLGAWNRSSDSLAFSGEAREVFNRLSQDLQGAILRSDGGQWFSLTTEKPIAGSSIDASSASRLIFFTNTPLHQTKDGGVGGGAAGKNISDGICAVEYRIVCADPFGATAAPGADAGYTKTFSLHRVVVDPASTLYGISNHPIMGLSDANAGGDTSLVKAFDELIDLTAGGNISSTTPPVAIPNFINGASPAALDVPVYGSYTTNSLFLNNVAQFNIFIYFNGQKATDQPPLQVYPQTAAAKVAGYFYGGAGNPTPANGYFDGLNGSQPDLPTFLSFAYADVTLTILTDAGAAELAKNNGSLSASVTWAQFLQIYGKTYTQRIPILATPH